MADVVRAAPHDKAIPCTEREKLKEFVSVTVTDEEHLGQSFAGQLVLEMHSVEQCSHSDGC